MRRKRDTKILTQVFTLLRSPSKIDGNNRFLEIVRFVQITYSCIPLTLIIFNINIFSISCR